MNKLKEFVHYMNMAKQYIKQAQEDDPEESVKGNAECAEDCIKQAEEALKDFFNGCENILSEMVAD